MRYLKYPILCFLGCLLFEKDIDSIQVIAAIKDIRGTNPIEAALILYGITSSTMELMISII